MLIELPINSSTLQGKSFAKVLCANKGNQKVAGLADKIAEVPKPEETSECAVAGVPVEIQKIIKDYGIWIAEFIIMAIALGYL